MFANMFLLSLLTIIYGTKGDEGGGSGAVEKNVLNFLSESQQRGDGECKYANIYVCFGDSFLCFHTRENYHMRSKLFFQVSETKPNSVFMRLKGSLLGGEYSGKRIKNFEWWRGKK